MRDPDRALWRSVKVRAAARTVAKKLGYKRVAALWGNEAEDEAIVSQKLEETNRRFLKVHELLGLMDVDVDGLIIAALCHELGYEVPERRVEPESDERRMINAYRDLFGPEVEELARRKAGL
jgi:hypothetical protein